MCVRARVSIRCVPVFFSAVLRGKDFIIHKARLSVIYNNKQRYHAQVNFRVHVQNHHLQLSAPSHYYWIPPGPVSICIVLGRRLFLLSTSSGWQAHENLERIVNHPLQSSQRSDHHLVSRG